MFDTDSDTLRDTEPTETESPKASSADSAADAAKKAADAEKREKRRARQKRQAFTEQMQNLTMDDIRRLMESSVDLGSVSDPQAEIESRIERNGMAYLMKDGAVYAVVLSSDDYERLADKKAQSRQHAKTRQDGRHRNTVAAIFMSRPHISEPPRRHGVRRAETLAPDTAKRLPAATRCPDWSAPRHSSPRREPKTHAPATRSPS